MKVIPPVTLTVGTNCTTTVSEPDGTYDPAAWSVATPYVEGNTVYVSASHKIYQAVTSVTGGSSPEIDVLAAVPKWIDIGFCNARKMFDTTRADTTKKTSPITLTITAGKVISAIAFLDMTNITDLLVTGTVLGTPTYNTASTHVNTTGLSQYVLWDLPPSTSLVLTVVMTGSGVLQCANVVVGMAEYLGDLQSGVTVDSVNFSTIDRDTYGTATIVKRRSVPKLGYNLHLLASKVNRAIAIRDSLNATPAVWVGMDDNIIPNYYNSLLVLGFYRNFSITLDSPIASTVSLELEEI